MLYFNYDDIFKLLRELNVFEDLLTDSVKEFYELEIKDYLSDKLKKILRQKALGGYTEKEIAESGIFDEIDTITAPDAILSFSAINEYVFEYNLPDSEIPDSIKLLNVTEEDLEGNEKFLEELLATIISKNIVDKMTGVIEIEGQAAEVM